MLAEGLSLSLSLSLSSSSVSRWLCITVYIREHTLHIHTHTRVCVCLSVRSRIVSTYCLFPPTPPCSSFSSSSSSSTSTSLERESSGPAHPGETTRVTFAIKREGNHHQLTREKRTEERNRRVEGVGLNGRKEVDTQSACARALFSPSPLLFCILCRHTHTHSQASFPHSGLVDKRQARPVDARVFAPQPLGQIEIIPSLRKPTLVISFRVLFESDIGQCKQQWQEETENWFFLFIV